MLSHLQHLSKPFPHKDPCSETTTACEKFSTYSLKGSKSAYYLQRTKRQQHPSLPWTFRGSPVNNILIWSGNTCVTSMCGPIDAEEERREKQHQKPELLQRHQAQASAGLRLTQVSPAALSKVLNLKRNSQASRTLAVLQRQKIFCMRRVMLLGCVKNHNWTSHKKL